MAKNDNYGSRLGDYVEVADRILDFYKAFPKGSLTRGDWGVREVDGKTFIVYTALAHRDPDDRHPGVGTAWEPFPGGTPYTKNSELMNAETSAWGRAIIATGLVSNGKIASREEVINRMHDGDSEPEPEPKPKRQRRKAKPDPTGDEIAKAAERELDAVPDVSLDDLEKLFGESPWTADDLIVGLSGVGKFVDSPDGIDDAMGDLSPRERSELAELMKASMR